MFPAPLHLIIICLFSAPFLFVFVTCYRTIPIHTIRQNVRMYVVTSRHAPNVKMECWIHPQSPTSSATKKTKIILLSVFMDFKCVIIILSVNILKLEL